MKRIKVHQPILLLVLFCIRMGLQAADLDKKAIEVSLIKSRAALQEQIVELKKLIAPALLKKGVLNDPELQERAAQVHALLCKHYFDPRTNMVYTILEPHTGQAVFPTIEEVHNNLPNANGWSTCIEDCAGYGNGKHLAWLAARHEATHKPEDAEFARAVFRGACVLGTIRKEKDPFRAIVRGVLPDGKTYYEGKGPGPGKSTGDNYNGYYYGMWKYYHSSLASDGEKRDIQSIIRDTDPRSGGVFAAMAADITGDREPMDRYEARKKPSIEKLAEQTATTYQSWTAVQLQLHYAALRELDPDPLCKRVYEHAMRGNAWGRCKDILAGLEFDFTKDDYAYRVKTVRNPLDGMLAVMLSRDREAIEALLPLYRCVIARYDFSAFRDQRQLTPFLGTYWLAVREGFLKYDPTIAPPELADVRLAAIDPSHTPVVTYFAACNPVAAGVHEDMTWVPGSPNWRAKADAGAATAKEGILTLTARAGGETSFEAISEPWLKRASSEHGYSIETRLNVPSGAFVISWGDGSFADELTIHPDRISLKNAHAEIRNSAAAFARYTIVVKGNKVDVVKDGQQVLSAELKSPTAQRRLAWGVRSDGPSQCAIDSFGYTVSNRFKYPHSDSR